jgi:hypothetical protein
MTKIISVIPLLIGLALPAALLRAEDQPTEPAEPMAPASDAAPEAAPKTEPVGMQDSAPSRYVVVKGDTLWGISSRYLKNPWKWPELWGINKDLVHNPHWIYPGDVLILDLTGATPRLRLEGAPDGGTSRWYGSQLQVTELHPQIRSQAAAATPIPMIPAKAIEPFLTRSLIMEPGQLVNAPMIVANNDQRVVISAGDTTYVRGLNDKKDDHWQVFRPGRQFQDPKTREILGFQAVYLGDADVMGFGTISTVYIASARQEIALGDRLALAPPVQNTSYMPHAPDKMIDGQVIAGSDSSVFELGTFSVVMLNRGARNGVEVGQVLGLFHSEGQIPLGPNKVIHMPEQRYGILLVFRVFEKMSFGLVMNSNRPVNVLDHVRNP